MTATSVRREMTAAMIRVMYPHHKHHINRWKIHVSTKRTAFRIRDGHQGKHYLRATRQKEAAESMGGVDFTLVPIVWKETSTEVGGKKTSIFSKQMYTEQAVAADWREPSSMVDDDSGVIATKTLSQNPSRRTRATGRAPPPAP